MSSEINHTLGLAAKTGFVFGQGPAIEVLNTMVADIARTDIAVLLIGESGSGNEVYAKLVHRLYGLKEAQLQKISCATLAPGRHHRQDQHALRTDAKHNG